jgi:phosphoribosylformimino-5-aminoimidazole carboxamide ribotide isomerase
MRQLMKIYPAIDMLDGKAVRLKQGRKEEATIYGHPVDMALRWVAKGAEWLHVVDLDGAFEGSPRNLPVLRDMTASVPDAKIQVGGGIRSMTTVETLLETGIRRVILGTAAVQDPAFVKNALSLHPGAVAIGIDARDGNVRVAGWTEDSQVNSIELALKLQDLGAQLVIYTDISRDGVLEGVNVAATREMLVNTELRVIASGGVSSMADLQRLAEIDHRRLDGVIIGKALYEGRIQIEEALAHAR